MNVKALTGNQLRIMQYLGENKMADADMLMQCIIAYEDKVMACVSSIARLRHYYLIDSVEKDSGIYYYLSEYGKIKLKEI